MTKSKNLKIQVCCPIESANDVRLAIGKAGGGKIGNYTYCAFVSSGYGYFLPCEGSDPAVGKVGKMQKVKEVKIEFVCEEQKVKQVVEAIKKVHPYEEILIGALTMLVFD